MAMINLRRRRQKESIHEYVKKYSALMLEIPEMFEWQRLCFFFDRLQQWVATKLPQREPHDLASAMAKIGSPKATDDERSRDKRRHHHHKGKKKHEGSRKWGDSHDHKARVGPRRGCFYCGGPYYWLNCPHKGKMIAFLEKDKGSKEDSSSRDREACMGALQMVNVFVQKSKEEAAKRKKSKKRQGLLYASVDAVRKTQEGLVDTRVIHNFMSPRVAEWLGLKPTKDGSWFMAVNAEERLTKGVIKNVDLRISGWTGKADFNIIDMDEIGVVLGMDFMKKSSTTLNPYYEVIAGKEGQLEWIIPLVSKDGADARKGIIVLQLDKRSTLCYGEQEMGPRTYTVDMLKKTVTTKKFKHCLSLIHHLSC
ncbi:hypothetical protein RJ639_042688 [Escallonia herrerae]|uniref:Retrotransposon gag domain-containing protein n=1 Tax=Escallonia herrerae TaxID=1293975 RepID=A0AA89AZU9_9ASTE|nr:hypothetical protein RJ639_042688 [Escallonia herrerae]